MLAVCRKYGWYHGGMSNAEWVRAAKKLGIKTKRLRFRQCKLGLFMKNRKKKTYIISTHGHVFVLDKGLIIDPRFKGKGLKRIVRQAWRVEKS